MAKNERVEMATLLCCYCAKKKREKKINGARQKAKKQECWRCVSRLIRGHRKKMETGSVSDKEKVNDSRSGTEVQEEEGG